MPRVKRDAPEYMTLDDIENEKFTNLEILTHLNSLREVIIERLVNFEEGVEKTPVKKAKGKALLLLTEGHQEEEHNTNSNSSVSSITLEKSGAKKFKIVAVEERPTEKKKSSVVAKKEKKPIVSVEKKKKNAKKIDSEIDEEDISLEDIDS